MPTKFKEPDNGRRLTRHGSKTFEKNFTAKAHQHKMIEGEDISPLQQQGSNNAFKLPAAKPVAQKQDLFTNATAKPKKRVKRGQATQ